MIKKIGILLFAGLALTACEKELHDLTMSRMPYRGNELRTDGYYYSTIPNYSDPTIGVIVLYRNGACMEMFLSDVRDADNKTLKKGFWIKILWLSFGTVLTKLVYSESIRIALKWRLGKSFGIP